MKLEKKHYIAGAIGLVTISGALLYLQYKKLMDYCLSFNRFALKKLSLRDAELDIFLNFKNKSAIKINIVSQDYVAYLNDKKIATFSNKNLVVIEPKATTVLPLNVKFQPIKLVNSLKSLATDFMLKPETVILKVKCYIKVKFWFLNLSIPYEYVTTIKDLMTDNQTNKSTAQKEVC